MAPKPITRKLVVLGDGACGKVNIAIDCIYQRLLPYLIVHGKAFDDQAVFENYVEVLQVDDQAVELSLWDTAGQEEFDRLRSLSYADTHVVMLCFSVDSPVSLENAESKWIQEIHEHCAGVKLILIALKCDLREDPKIKDKLSRRSLHPVTYDEGLAVARRIKATRYLECSAKHNRGVQEAILEAARVSLGTKARGGSGLALGEHLGGEGMLKGCQCVVM